MPNKIAVTKNGYDVLTETNPDNLNFSSDYNTLKYDTSGNTTASIPANVNPFVQEDVIVTHNLNYIPFFVGYMREFALDRWYNLPYSFTDVGYIHWYFYATTTQLILRTEMSNNVSDFDFTVWYKIFKNNTGL